MLTYMRHCRFLKKLDGYPVIRELDNDEEEEVSSILDMNEIDRLAKYMGKIYFSFIPQYHFVLLRGDSDDEEDNEEEPQPVEHPEPEEDEHNPEDEEEDENDSQVGSDVEDSVDDD